MRRRQDIDARQRRWAAGGSLLLHALLIVLAVTTLRSTQRGTPATNLPKSIQIVLAPPAPPAPPVVVPPPPPEPPKEPPTPEPTPVPAKPKVVPKPVDKPLPAKPAGSTKQEPTKAPAVIPEETPEESLIGRLHENWLEPARMQRNFQCLIRIDYLVGGRISAVTFVKSCGSYELDESVKKAIYKSQPLPLVAAKTTAGTIEVEFTP